MSLFRPEVDPFAEPKAAMIIPTPRAITGLLMGAGAVVVALAAFVASAEYARRVEAAGTISPSGGLVRVAPLMEGRIVDLHVIEGQRVEIGDPIATLAADRTMTDGGAVVSSLRDARQSTRQAIEQMLQADLASLVEREGAMQDRIAAIRREIAVAQDERDTRAKQETLAAQTLERQRALAEKGYLTRIQLEQAESAALTAAAAVKAIDRDLLQMQRGMDQAVAELQDLPNQRAKTEGLAQERRASISREDAQAEAMASLTLRSPIAGRVGALRVDIGHVIPANTPIATLVPEGVPMRAVMQVPSAAIGFVKPGQRVVLRYEAFPYQKYGHQFGAISSVARAPLDPTDAGNPSSQGVAPSYRVVVDLESQVVDIDGTKEPLIPGMSVTADILLERRTVFAWLFEDLFGMRERLGARGA